ncbi:hypothetical protein ACROYT_G028250 [Oculina patagonica]
MQTQQNEERPSFLNGIVKNEESTSMCTVKQENSPIDDSCQLTSPTLYSPVKRPLIDNQHEMTTPNSKRMKRERDDPSFWANKEILLLANKTSLQNIVSEVADSFESSNGVSSASFQGFESSNRTLSAEDNTTALESSPRIAESANEVKAGYENVEASAHTVDCRKGEISVLSTTDQAQNETSKPILRPLKSKDSGISEGLAYDHNFFPKLIGVHSVISPTPSSPEVESYHDSQQARDAPLLEKLDQNQQTHNSSLLKIAEDVLTTVSNGSVIRHCTAKKGHVMPENTDRIMSPSMPLSSRAQTTTTCNANLYKRNVLESSKVHAQKTPRTLPIVPLALAIDKIPDLSTDFSPDLSDPWISATMSSQREQVTEPQRVSQSVAKRSAVNVCTSSLHEKRAAAATAHAQAQGHGRRKAVDSTSQLSPVPSQVSPRAHDQIYSSKPSSSTSSTKLKSVNRKEVVNIYRMAASASSHKNQSKNTSVHSPTFDAKSQESCDLLFSFTKPDGKNDLFLVINDEVFAVKRFDYKGVSYLIHIDSKGKTSVLAKLPEAEKRKLENNDTGASSGQQFPEKRASASDIASNDSKQSRRTSSQRFTSHHPTETSLSVTALQNFFAQTFSDENAEDIAHETFGQRQDLDGMSRVIRCQGRQQQTKSLDVNEVLSERQTVHGGEQAESSKNRPISFSRSGSLNSERRQLLKQFLNVIRTETSAHSQRPLVTNLPQSLPDGQQCCTFQTCVDRHQRSAVPNNTRSTTRSAHASSSNSLDNQQFIGSRNLAARNQGNNEMNVYSREPYTDTAAQSTYNGDQAVTTRRQRHFNKETVDEVSYGTFACSKPSLMNENRILQRMKLMNYIAHRLASKQDHVPSAVNTLDCHHPVCRRSDITRQTSNRTMANALNTTRTANVASSRMHEELPPHQQCQRFMELLEGDTANATHYMGGVNSSSRKRTVKGSQVAQTLTATIPTPQVSKMPQSVIRCMRNCEDESQSRRATTHQVDQQRSLYVDTTSDWLIHEECRSGFTGQRLVNDRRAISGLHVNQSRTVLSPVPSWSDGETCGFIQKPQRLRNDTAFQGEHYFTNSASDNLSMSSSNCHSFMSRTPGHFRSVSACGAQQHFTKKRPPRQNAHFNECDANIAFDEAVRKTCPSLEEESVSALITGKQSCIDDESVRDTVEVTKPCEVSKKLDADKTETDDEVVEIISLPPRGDFSPYTTLDVENKGNDEIPMEQDAYKSSNSARRAELVKKIQTTQERVAKEKVDWKKKHLNSLNIEQDKKLAKESAEVDVVVIDDD